MQGDEAQKVRRTRLVEDRGYDPWVRAEQGVGDATLLWLPVSSFPVRHNEKAWLSELLDRLANALTTQFALRQELFLQFKNVDEFSDDFRRYVNTCMIRVGIGRAGEEPFSGMPSPEEIQQIVDERRSFDYKDWMADYLVWFVGKDPEGQRRLFSGYGAMMTAFMAPGPTPATPKFNITPAMRQQAPRYDFRGGDIEDNDVKRLVTKSGNRIQISDKPGQEGFFFGTPKHTSLTLTENPMRQATTSSL